MVVISNSSTIDADADGAGRMLETRSPEIGSLTLTFIPSKRWMNLTQRRIAYASPISHEWKAHEPEAANAWALQRAGRKRVRVRIRAQKGRAAGVSGRHALPFEEDVARLHVSMCNRELSWSCAKPYNWRCTRWTEALDAQSRSVLILYCSYRRRALKLPE